jgi:hypothetical protein
VGTPAREFIDLVLASLRRRETLTG